MLAPVGGIISTFDFFPFFYMDKFGFSKLFDSEINITIDGKAHNPTKIPILVDGSFVYLCRYSFEPVIAELNPRFDVPLVPIQVGSLEQVSSNHTQYTFYPNKGFKELVKLETTHKNKKASIVFSPSFPDIINLKDNTVIVGRFTLNSNGISGIVGGEYSVTKNGGSINLELKPIKAYSPMNGPLWVKNYHWQAKLTFSPTGILSMTAKWIIKDQKD